MQFYILILYKAIPLLRMIVIADFIRLEINTFIARMTYNGVHNDLYVVVSIDVYNIEKRDQKNVKRVRVIVLNNISVILWRWKKQEYLEKVTELCSDKLDHVMLYRAHLTYERDSNSTTWVVICTDCSSSRISNNHTIATTVCPWLAFGRWYFPGTPVSSTNKTDCYDITEILTLWRRRKSCWLLSCLDISIVYFYERLIVKQDISSVLSVELFWHRHL